MSTNPVQPNPIHASPTPSGLTPAALEARPRQIDDPARPAVATLSSGATLHADLFPLEDLKIYFAARNRLLPVLADASSAEQPVHLKVRKSTRDSVLAQLDRGTYYVDYSSVEKYGFIEEGGKIAGIPVLWCHLQPRATNPERSWLHPEDVIDEFYLMEHPYVEK